jgi:signal transduction histidine kinase
MDGILQQKQSPELKDRAAAEINALIDRAIQQVRSMSHLLHPPLLDEVGLSSALEQYLEGFTKRSGIEARIEGQLGDLPRFKPELETAIFRIIQEALTNVFRHSGARKAWVTVSKLRDQIAVTVRDDGKGISDNIIEFRPGSVGIGIGGMRQREKEFGGEVRLRNVNPGTLVEVSIPTNSVDGLSQPVQFAARQ